MQGFKTYGPLFILTSKLSKATLQKKLLIKVEVSKGVLEPFSMKGNFDLLKRSGFEDIATIFKYVPFAGIISIK